MSYLILIFAYLLGSIPFGFLIVKLKSGADVRQTGSGGTGATNVTRKAGKGAGVVTLILDALKGTAAVLLARWLTGEAGTSWVVAGAAVLAVVGHCFPVWLKFKAGKGVATGLGVFLAIVPWAVLAAAAVFLLIVWRTRFVSLGSVLAAAVVPLWTLIQHTLISPLSDFAPIMAALCAASAIIIIKHHENIQRLLAGTENRFGAAKTTH
ncbi:MAG TPA: glycerol-3-phosphate 1-O-acyltransferase PlsY [Blastocatellia bacterium]|nr:glycerol-3-phosphate 1-O-acyltransferase PlsY [Blastocatellia bacterium]HMX27035.1 glycerol-3-phosphate 1-O-acyltransferase PlsY [Blastocatellia bacterium]HMZ16616.1 glycerol-3-phosphate 1-O-acyltransferase PlsY [Blastocatellia bacterium]HNG28191.1 glycerol-3-phosphate 1-O-acyltransferase PlsY [Blastocatellia bacterium]